MEHHWGHQHKNEICRYLYTHYQPECFLPFRSVWLDNHRSEKPIRRPEETAKKEVGYSFIPASKGIRMCRIHEIQPNRLSKGYCCQTQGISQTGTTFKPFSVEM